MWKSSFSEVQGNIGKLSINKGYSIYSSHNFGIEAKSLAPFWHGHSPTPETLTGKV
jgi:hypothetical protein